jgi:hypothetical protein
MARLLSAVGMCGLVPLWRWARRRRISCIRFRGDVRRRRTVTGTFTTNDAITALLDFDVTTSAGVGIGFEYTPATADSSSTSLPFILVLNTPPALDNILQLTFSGGLTALGAPLTIGAFDSFEQTTAPAQRQIVAGEVIVAPTAVPEPSTIALTGIGALGLLLSSVRRRARA